MGQNGVSLSTPTKGSRMLRARRCRAAFAAVRKGGWVEDEVGEISPGAPELDPFLPRDLEHLICLEAQHLAPHRGGSPRSTDRSSSSALRRSRRDGRSALRFARRSNARSRSRRACSRGWDSRSGRSTRSSSSSSLLSRLPRCAAAASVLLRTLPPASPCPPALPLRQAFALPSRVGHRSTMRRIWRADRP